MININFQEFWIAFVNLQAKEGFKFNELIELGENSESKFKGAWANILVKEQNLIKAIEIINEGLRELNFDVIFIDKIENISSLIEYNELNNEVISEIEWLNKSNFVFKISDGIFPYE